MFCQKCGSRINDNSCFCPNCGELIVIANNEGANIPQKSIPVQTRFVPAKCTNCGGALNVDPSKEAAICPFCNQPYIVEKAINNFNISVNGSVMINRANINVEGAPSIKNLLARAKSFAQKGDIITAIEYYNRVLDIDINCKEAQRELERIKNKPFATINANRGLSQGKLELRKDMLVFTTKKGKQFVYKFSEIVTVKKGFGGFLNITTTKKNPFNPSANLEESFGINGGKKVILKWVEMINNAINGRYPPLP